jgi:hypothetical protein
MPTQVEQAVDELFPQEGSRVRDVKFHPGRSDRVTAEQLAAELLSANRQIRDGTATRVTDIDGNLDD